MADCSPTDNIPSPGDRSECETFWERHVPGILAQARDTTFPELSATGRFVLSGPGGGEWTVHVLRGVVERVERNSILEPTLTVRLAADEFLAIVNGRQDHRESFFQGKIEMDGDVELALWVSNLIPVFREKFPFRSPEYRTF